MPSWLMIILRIISWSTAKLWIFRLPEYRVVGHHEGIFYIDTYINGQFGGRGEAKSKKQAEQLAARAFFEQLKKLSATIN